MHLINVQIQNQFLQHGNGHNKFLVWAFVASFTVIFAILFVPTLRNIFSLTTLKYAEWAIVIVLSVLPVILVEITKWAKRKFGITVI